MTCPSSRRLSNLLLVLRRPVGGTALPSQSRQTALPPSPLRRIQLGPRASSPLSYFVDRRAEAWVGSAKRTKGVSLAAGSKGRGFSSCGISRSDEKGKGKEEVDRYNIGDISDQEYHAVADLTMEKLTEYLEALIEDTEGAQDAFEGCDVEYSAGVLNLNLGPDNGIYVINKQPPNKQIWLSSPKSGPKRYDYDPRHKVWFYHRDGSLLKDLLDEELSKALNWTVSVDLGQDEES